MHEDYQLCPTLTPEDNIEVDKELYRLCRGTGSFLLQALGPPSDEDEDLQENPPEMIDGVTYTCQKGESVINYLKNVYNLMLFRKLSKSLEARVKKYRHGRITSSLFSKVCHLREGSQDNYKTREILIVISLS